MESSKLSDEIQEIEKAFCDYGKIHGVASAFVEFAAEDAVINRNNKIYKGKEEIGHFYSSLKVKIVSLDWHPSFIDGSEDMTMAYTYGNYEMKYLAETEGEIQESRGIFHTVWKKQKDGTWKYVYD